MENTILGPTAKDYKKFAQHIHVYKKPSMYIGDIFKEPKKDWLYSFNENKIYKGTTDISDGAERLFLEGIMNASDNVGRSKDLGVDPGIIIVKMNNMEISIYNEGLPIPVEKNEEGIYIPEMLFGELLTSSNYDSEEESEEDEMSRKKIDGAGTNGIGAKAMNIFSTYFKIIIHDHIRKKKYSQVWRNNMQDKDEPEINSYKANKSSVEIIYHMDFKKFKYQPVDKIGNPFNDYEIEGGYTKDVFELYARHCAALSWINKIPVEFNNLKFNIKNVKEFARLIYQDQVDNSLIYYQWPNGTEVKFTKNKYYQAIDTKINPLIEVLVLDSPDKGEIISYVNGNPTREGGTHVDAIWNIIGKKILGNMKDKMKNDKDINTKLVVGDIKPHLTLFVSFIKVDRPQFDSQSKNKLRSPKQKELAKNVSIPDESYTIINSWLLYKRLTATLKFKNIDLLKDTDGKNQKYLGKDDKVIEANYAADRKLNLRLSTIFYICEGDSASLYVAGKRSYMEGTIGNDTIGYMPIKGKGLNVMKAKNKKIRENKVIINIKRYLGLVEGRDYSIDSNYHTLRYGKVCILADSDDDGSHIVGLTLLYFYFFFPSLLKRDFLYYERTPLFRLYKGNNILKFYSLTEYEKWKSENDSKSWTMRFFKGLAASNDDDIEDDTKDPKIIKFILDENANLSINKVFGKNETNQRKKWISNSSSKNSDFSIIKEQEITKFIDDDFVQYAIASLSRSIPKMIDGLKESQRKVLYSVFIKWRVYSTDSYKPCKISQFQGLVSEKSKYQHGEANLEKTIVNMARDFIGTNNIPIFEKDGQFGSRLDGNLSGSGRYISILPKKIIKYIFKDEDTFALKYKYEEKDKIEPENYLPIIPMILVNGCNGLATGYSTYTPNFNPLQIIEWLKQRINNVDESLMTEVNPWYFGFKGTIKIIDRRTKKKRGNKVKVTTIKNENIIQISETNDIYNDDNSSSLLDSNDDKSDDEIIISNYLESIKNDESRPLLTVITYGEYYIKDNKIIITELPIGVWCNDYKNKILEWISEKKVKSFYDGCKINQVYFEIIGFEGPINHKSLGLIKSFGMSNMVFLDRNNKPIRYDTQYEILEDFYDQRLPYYFDRKNNLLSTFKNEINYLKNKNLYINAVLEGTIDIRNKDDDEIEEQFKNQNISLEYINDLLSLAYRSFSKNKVKSIKEEIKITEDMFNKILNMRAQDLWIEDLNILENEYKNYLIDEDSKINKNKKIKHKL